MASSVTWGHASAGKVRVITAAVTCHTDGTFTATAIPYAIEGRLLMLQTNPGATAPQDNYDIELIDADGLDRLCAVGMNRDTATSEQAPIVFASTSIHPPVDVAETLTLTITNNNVNGALIAIRLYYTPDL